MKKCLFGVAAVRLELLLDVGAGVSGAKLGINPGDDRFVCGMEMKDELAAICDERGCQGNRHRASWWLAARYDLPGLCGAGEEQLAKLGISGFFSGATGVGGEGEGERRQGGTDEAEQGERGEGGESAAGYARVAVTPTCGERGRTKGHFASETRNPKPEIRMNAGNQSSTLRLRPEGKPKVGRLHWRASSLEELGTSDKSATPSAESCG